MKPPKLKRKIRFPGIGIVAQTMGVSREHLYRVLIGEHQSTTLTQAWADYQRGTLQSDPNRHARKQFWLRYSK